ncbi:altronate dehydratase [Thiospirochaeta perfilievii]|uniref:Altronate dehydratase n=1 Tax=Thiospirochaeta perfilievii TaxID=252967 RepID=A0A5C1QA05_9SPIO|nr:altronate dehydratase family protein [Thiospirochaeta perfilievii]QEN04311.1 altronate dehydratase [Thiospirochaeta perfilievii]
MKKVIQINPKDSVAVALEPLYKGDIVVVNDVEIKLLEDIGQAHKFALMDIKNGDMIIKYASPIAHAIKDIKQGEFVHSHNIKTNLDGILEYNYNKEEPQYSIYAEDKYFMGFLRSDGQVGIRNDIWIINTVGCINRTAENIVKNSGEGVYTFVHPYGCSQLGSDHKNTQLILKNLVKHPNAGGVLVLGLGCENNNITEFKKVLGSYDESRVRFLETQTVEDELDEALKIIAELKNITLKDKRERFPVSKLKIGLKCGGSDGLSGITANPLVGKLSNKLIDMGGISILTEVPEMFGAETILMNRAKSKEIYNKTVSLVNNFKEYFKRYNQVVYENPSPGNKDGGITTLEEKSLGCIQKGGEREVQAVLNYGEIATESGLNLLNGPGNDIVAVTNLSAAGAHLILFTTGRGTPLGGPVPTVKISTNNLLAKKKGHWIDYNAGTLVDNGNIDKLSEDFLEYILEVASGKQTLNEINNYREISIFKDGVTL